MHPEVLHISVPPDKQQGIFKRTVLTIPQVPKLVEVTAHYAQIKPPNYQDEADIDRFLRLCKKHRIAPIYQTVKDCYIFDRETRVYQMGMIPEVNFDVINRGFYTIKQIHMAAHLAIGGRLYGHKISLSTPVYEQYGIPFLKQIFKSRRKIISDGSIIFNVFEAGDHGNKQFLWDTVLFFGTDYFAKGEDGVIEDKDRGTILRTGLTLVIGRRIEEATAQSIKEWFENLIRFV